MRKSTDRILTTHVGSLPAPPDLWSLEDVDAARLREATNEVVKFQRDCGVDIVNEGELTKGGSWVVFINDRTEGFESAATDASVTLLRDSEDWRQFGNFYQAALEGGTLFEQTRAAQPVGSRRLDWACTSAVKYVGQAALQREMELLRAALGDTPP